MRLATIGVVATATVASAGTVTFEELGTQPFLFRDTNALRNQIDGVSFSGPGANDGGAILNQEGGFGFDARSGEHFLAFNRSPFVTYMSDGRAVDPQRISFDTPVSSVDIYAATGWNDDGDEQFGSYLIQAYTAAGDLVGESSIVDVGLTWTLLSVQGSKPIDYVVLTETTGTGAFAYDDLSYSSVPSAGSASLLAIAGAIGTRRRRA